MWAGRQAVSKLQVHNQQIVVIDEREISKEETKNSGVIFIEGDSTKDELLHEAQVSRAKAVITALPSDADNLYVVLSVRQLRPDITIISRVSNESSNSKLKAAPNTPNTCLLYTSPSPRDRTRSRMPSSA